MITAMNQDLLAENKRLRGDLLTIARRISHDLRTPLGGIINASEAIREILAATDPTPLPLVTASLNSAEELAQIIRRVSLVLKATALPCTPQLMPMGEAVSAALVRLEAAILEKSVIIAQPDTWPEVVGVGDWLEVVWWNLLANALQHGGSPSRIELGWRPENERCLFWVSDDGRGVSEEKREQLFQPFHRLHESDATRGLGLSIVQRLMELQGGVCHYNSNPTGGAGFFFALPINAARD